jgi:uncharacterized protein YlaN (UPF0358 family)
MFNLFLLFNLFNGNKSIENSKELVKKRQKEISKERYTARWWQKQVPNLTLQQVACYLQVATRQGLCDKEESEIDNAYKVFIPKNNDKEIIDFLKKRLTNN